MAKTWAQKSCENDKYQAWANDILMVSGLAWLAIALSGKIDKYGSFLSFMDGSGMKQASRVFQLVVGLAGVYALGCRLFYPKGKKGADCKAGCDCKSGTCTSGKCA